MKHAIFQYFLNYNGVGKLTHYRDLDGIPDWAERSVNYFKHYAKRHGADHYFFTDRFVNASSNYFEILRLYKDPVFEQYDKVLYLDVDVMPKNMDANIFDLEIGDVAGWPEWKHPDLAEPTKWSSSKLAHRFQHFGSKIVQPKTVTSDVRMLNSGVLLWSKEARIKAREKFDDHEAWYAYKNRVIDPSLPKEVGHSSHCLDQPFINAMLCKYDFDVTELDIVWNRFPTKDENRKCNFAHYVGDARYNIPKWFPEIVDED